MKNKISIITVVILSVLLGIVSCKKDNLELSNPDNNNHYSQQIMKCIKAFSLQMKGNFKSGSMMTIDTAVWNLEALLTNYGGYPDSASKRFILMKAHFTLPVDANGLVLESDVQTVYQQMVDSITSQLNTIAGDVKFLKFSDVQQDSVVGNTAYLTSNNGYGQGLILGLYDPFTEDWVWGTLGNPENPPYSGNCDGTDLTSDGSNEIQFRLNHPAAVSAARGYTDIVTKEMTGWDFEDANGPRLYVGTDIYHCMTINELTDNLTNADDIIKTYTPDGLRPAGKEFISTVIDDDVTVGSTYYLHYYSVSYGIPYFYSE